MIKLLLYKVKELFQKTVVQRQMNIKRKKKTRELINNLTHLRGVVDFIDSQLPNRRAKKVFWSEFIKNDSVRTQTMVRLINSYNNILVDEK